MNWTYQSQLPTPKTFQILTQLSGKQTTKKKKLINGGIQIMMLWMLIPLFNVLADPLWYETTADEIRTFFTLNILFGIKQLPEIPAYWSKNPFLGVPEVQKVFSRNRFMKISQYLHLNDKSKELPRGDANHDKLFKVRPLLDAVVVSIKSEYLPSKCISIDKAMIPFKGRLGMKQYMPQKLQKGA